MNIFKKVKLHKELGVIAGRLIDLCKTVENIEFELSFYNDMIEFVKKYPITFKWLIRSAEEIYDLSIREFEILMALGKYDLVEKLQLDVIEEKIWEFKQAQECAE